MLSTIGRNVFGFFLHFVFSYINERKVGKMLEMWLQHTHTANQIFCWWTADGTNLFCISSCFVYVSFIIPVYVFFCTMPIAYCSLHVLKWTLKWLHHWLLLLDLPFFRHSHAYICAKVCKPLRFWRKRIKMNCIFARLAQIRNPFNRIVWFFFFSILEISFA